MELFRTWATSSATSASSTTSPKTTSPPFLLLATRIYVGNSRTLGRYVTPSLALKALLFLRPLGTLWRNVSDLPTTKTCLSWFRIRGHSIYRKGIILLNLSKLLLRSLSSRQKSVASFNTKSLFRSMGSWTFLVEYWELNFVLDYVILLCKFTVLWDQPQVLQPPCRKVRPPSDCDWRNDDAETPHSF